MTDLSEDTIQDIHETFSLMDTTGNDTIALNMVGTVLRALNLNPTEADICKVLNNPTADELATKKVTFNEFMPILAQTKKQAERGSYEDFVEGLRVFDKENNGTVLGAELRHVLATLGERMSEEEVDQLMSGQEDANGCINYEVFIKKVLDKDI
uniref:Myosin light chain n=1 Tax=Molgula tectiformis TaxID=30286 RepID=A0A9Q4_MOLTE|nr:myosin light chain [Molgula tectiformis]